MIVKDRKVVFLMEKSSIVIKGLEKRLNAEHIQTISLVENFDKIEEHVKDTGVYVVYNPMDILDAKNGHKQMVLIKDQIKDCKGRIIFIGEAGDKETLTKEYPELYVHTWLDRPVDPDVFVTTVDEELKDYEKRLERDAREDIELSEDEVMDPDMGFAPPRDDGRKKILIVDDDASYAKMVKSWIKDRYKTDVVTAGMQAISFLLKKPVDLILLDYEMPVVDGPQVLQMLRQEPATKDIPVVFLTGVSTREGVQRVMELKPAGYILKSTTSENLIMFLDDKLR
ncbi:response regulator [Butyrivibrio sp. AE3004]|uniref:response regulator n=1 Tax=Butyrivibrio sp. AE3004 TaxID=1506994 RepID=UPI000692504E|nr:response regulator [Butyrivibrio sp. AE3004]